MSDPDLVITSRKDDVDVDTPNNEQIVVIAEFVGINDAARVAANAAAAVDAAAAAAASQAAAALSEANADTSASAAADSKTAAEAASAQAVTSESNAAVSAEAAAASEANASASATAAAGSVTAAATSETNAAAHESAASDSADAAAASAAAAAAYASSVGSVITPQAANVIFSGPASGGSAMPAFRALASADIPTTLVGDRVFSNNVTAGGLHIGAVEANVVLNVRKSDATAYSSAFGANVAASDIAQLYNTNAAAAQASMYMRALDAAGRIILVRKGTSLADFVWQLRNGGGTTPEAMRLSSAGWLNIGSYSAVQGYNVLNYGADPTNTTSSVAAFQAAIDATTDGKPVLIHVPQGTYKGNMATGLNTSNRSVTFIHHGAVSYPDGAPVQAGTDNTKKINLIGYPFNGDSTRHWWQGEFAIGKNVTSAPVKGTSYAPLLRLQQNSDYFNGDATDYNMVSLVLNVNQTNGNCGDDQNALSSVVNCYRSGLANGPQITQVAANLYHYKKAISNVQQFGANILTRDETTRKSSASGGSMSSLEIDLVASGPDDAGVRFILDVVGRGYTSSSDGASTIQYGVRIRPANQGTDINNVDSMEPMQLVYALHIDPGTLGSIGTGVHLGTMAVGIELAGAYSTAALSIAANQKVLWNGSTLAQLWNTTDSRLEIQNSGVERIGFNVSSNPAIFLNGSAVLKTTRTGWTAATGTAARGAFATSTATVADCAQHLKALIDDLMTHGIIGA